LEILFVLSLVGMFLLMNLFVWFFVFVLFFFFLVTKKLVRYLELQCMQQSNDASDKFVLLMIVEEELGTMAQSTGGIHGTRLSNSGCDGFVQICKIFCP
jgi:hypothetical protein